MAVATPLPFKRGQTFSFSMRIPDSIADGFLASWQPTAQLRRARNDSPSGLIAEIACYWLDPDTSRVLGFHHHPTDGWPLGPAEFDVLFTSAGGQTLRSNTILFDIVRGITR